jgi:hypothetical protein
MRVDRGASQILFGFLPNQTVDLSGGVWRVSRWVDPVPLSLDQEALRSALLSAINPWVTAGRDDGFADALLHRVEVDVVAVNRDRGVIVEPVPRQWRCKLCNRVSREANARCACGGNNRAQLHFVAFHACGALDEPSIPRCPHHGEVAISLPGTTRLSEIRFSCPTCGHHLSWGFRPTRCACGDGYMRIGVHRAATVYTPHFAVVVNPPDPTVAARIRAAGGGARALEWVLKGMRGNDPMQGPQTRAGLMDTLMRAGLSEETARALVQEAASRGDVTEGDWTESIRLPNRVREAAQEEALSLASAVAGGRIRIEDMVQGTSPPLRTLYEGAYRNALRDARLEAVDLLHSFPVATVAFGYTRDGTNPGDSRLVTFQERGRPRVYGSVNRTEALLFRLDPLAVHSWLVSWGVLRNTTPATAEEARLAILEDLVIPRPGDEHPQALGAALATLVHSYAHRVVRRLSAFAGIERDSLSEYLVPHHLAFVVYAASRGEFVLGGLQAVFETSLHRFLDDFRHGESRCPLDPGCRSGGGACMACLHLGEPSCRWFNRLLDRAVLFGSLGYLR